MGKLLAFWLVASLFGANCAAQTGPTRPRFVMSKPPPQFDSVITEAGMRTYIDLQIDATGRVSEVRILKSSGSADYDERVQKYYRKWRLIPAISADGVPMASHLRMGHSLRGMSVAEDWDKATLSPTTDPDAPKNAEPEPVDPRVFDESGRVLRMHCKDFLWEYGLLREIAGASAPFDLERMVRLSLWEAARRAGGEPLLVMSKLKGKTNRLLREAAKTCESRPDDLYVERSLVPAVQAYLAR